MMRKLNEEKGITFIFSSHDPKIIDYAKRVIWLRDGSIDKEQ
jgi:putative ABC transport system ATP-binding protein